MKNHRQSLKEKTRHCRINDICLNEKTELESNLRLIVPLYKKILCSLKKRKIIFGAYVVLVACDHVKNINMDHKLLVTCDLPSIFILRNKIKFKFNTELILMCSI